MNWKTIWNLGFPKVLVGILLALYVMQISAKCETEEVEICSKNSSKGCFCRTCISCPAGFGPTHQCGGQYMNGTVITCKPCMNGVSFSEEHSISSCQPCPQCGGRETLQKCTPKSETSCGSKCKRGYIMNHAVEVCVRDPSFITTSPSIYTALRLTTDLPETTIIIIPAQPTSTATTQVKKKQRETAETSRHTTEAFERKGQPSSNKDPDHSRDNKIILTAIFILLVVFLIIVAFAAYFLRKTFFHHDAMNQDEKKALTSKDSTSSPRSSLQATGPTWQDDLLLTALPHTLKSDISIFISGNSPGNWLAIGGMLKLNEHQLRGIDIGGQKLTTNHGEQLLTVLASCQPDLTVTGFVEILENLKRKDVIKAITTYYNVLNQTNSAVQIDESQV